jgi:hypothetical protein
MPTGGGVGNPTEISYRESPILTGFGSTAHERMIARFRDLDRRIIGQPASRLLAAWLGRPPSPVRPVRQQRLRLLS